MLIARCSLAGAGDRHMLMLTRRRLVVTARSWLTRRLRLHLNLELRHLSDVNWARTRRPGRVRLSVTAIDGVREHFLIDAPDTAGVEHLLGSLFLVDRHNLREVVASAGV